MNVKSLIYLRMTRLFYMIVLSFDVRSLQYARFCYFNRTFTKRIFMGPNIWDIIPGSFLVLSRKRKLCVVIRNATFRRF